MLPEACVSHRPVCHPEVSAVDGCKWILILVAAAAERCLVLISPLLTPRLLSFFLSSYPSCSLRFFFSPRLMQAAGNTVVSRGRQSLFTHQSPSLAQAWRVGPRQWLCVSDIHARAMCSMQVSLQALGFCHPVGWSTCTQSQPISLYMVSCVCSH